MSVLESHEKLKFCLGDFLTKDVATRELEPAKWAYAEVEFNMMPATVYVDRFHLCPEMHAMAKMAKLAKNRQLLAI